MVILRQKSVTRMYRLNVRYFSRAYYAGYVKITRGTRSPADTDGLVGEPYVQGIYISLRIYGDCADAQFFAGAYDP